jgi:hypothetical protein
MMRLEGNVEHAGLVNGASQSGKATEASEHRSTHRKRAGDVRGTIFR